MKGIVFLGDKKLEIQNFPDPTPGPDDVIIEIQASGMCGSDLKFYRANSGPSSLGLGGDDKPVIAGHEPCGVIVEIGPNVPKNLFSIGMRVMQHHYQGCGTCSHCSTGWQQLCDSGVKAVFGVTGHGAHAKYMKCPVSTIVPLRDDISFIAGYDSATVKDDIVVQTYGEMVLARTGSIEGEVGHIDTAGVGSAVIVDVLKNGSSIYSTKPQFASTATTMTAGTRSTTTFSSGDRLTFKVIQIGSSTAGQGVRFMLKCKA